MLRHSDGRRGHERDHSDRRRRGGPSCRRRPTGQALTRSRRGQSHRPSRAASPRVSQPFPQGRGSRSSPQAPWKAWKTRGSPHGRGRARRPSLARPPRLAWAARPPRIGNDPPAAHRLPGRTHRTLLPGGLAHGAVPRQGAPHDNRTNLAALRLVRLALRFVQRP